MSPRVNVEWRMSHGEIIGIHLRGWNFAMNVHDGLRALSLYGTRDGAWELWRQLNDVFAIVDAATAADEHNETGQ